MLPCPGSRERRLHRASALPPCRIPCRRVRCTSRRLVEPAPQPADEEPSEEPKPATPVAEPRRKRDWGSIFQKAIDKINGSFTHAEDEEI